MDEADTGTTADRDAIAAEAARQWAEQRRAHVRAQFVTPSWIGPDRGTTTAAQIPPQAQPDHDELEFVVPVRPGVPILDSADWTEKARPRVFSGTVLTLALLAAVTSLVITIITQSPVAIAGLAASAIVAVIFRGALMGAEPTTVELKGSMLRIRKGGVVNAINLADPMQVVELVGSPDRPTWRLHLETFDGRAIEVGPKMVDAPELHRIVEHYRKIADRARREREDRFRR